MTSRSFLGGCVILMAAVAGCYTGGDITPPNRTTPASTTTNVDGTEPTAAAITGVPCDVAEVLAKDCASCHGTTPSGGAPNPMMSYDDLAKKSLTDPTTDETALSIRRMKDTKNPMPPDGASADDLAILEKWYADGMPKGTETCDVTPAASAYDTPSVCSSGTKWTRGDNRGSTSMDPGQACNACHDRGRGPSYTLAGTVYKTAHEPDNCNGSGALKIVITDAKNVVTTLTANAAGNFFTEATIAMPYKAKVVDAQGRTRSMSGPQKNGDCNLCHTEQGIKLPGDKQEAAPGRVMAP